MTKPAHINPIPNPQDKYYFASPTCDEPNSIGSNNLDRTKTGRNTPVCQGKLTYQNNKHQHHLEAPSGA